MSKPQPQEIFYQLSLILRWYLVMKKGQIQTLEKLRDNLLPKLMSGEVRVGIEGASE